MKNSKAATLTRIAAMTAITCIMGPLSIPLPFSPVPISLTVLAVYLSAYVLGMKYGTISYITYLLIGFVGAPVFSGFTGGAGRLAGPTGGYLIGFIFMALIVGFFIDHFNANTVKTVIGMILGTIVCYVFCTLWLAHSSGTSFVASLQIGVLPYIPADIIKMIIAIIIGKPVRKAMHSIKS